MFEQLYRRHAREVYQYALALLTNPADAEDATQTAFLNAYRAFQRGERPQKPHNWLIAITHNVCRMRWRQAGCRPREVALEEAPEPATLDHERPNLEEVLNALTRLSFNQRAATRRSPASSGSPTARSKRSCSVRAAGSSSSARPLAS